MARKKNEELDGPNSHSELLKVEYAPVMQALYRSMKRYMQPGIQTGVAEVAELLGRDECVMRQQFGPTRFECAPTVHAFLQVLETLESREAVHEIAALAGCTTIPRDQKASAVGAPGEDAAAFAALAPLVGQKLHTTTDRLNKAGRLSVAERTAAREALFDIIAFAAHLVSRVR